MFYASPGSATATAWQKSSKGLGNKRRIQEPCIHYSVFASQSSLILNPHTIACHANQPDPTARTFLDKLTSRLGPFHRDIARILKYQSTPGQLQYMGPNDCLLETRVA